jgi:DNA (cytosine-5)-methyltransferase 1
MKKKVNPANRTQGNELKVLDLFSGCGGLSYGFHRAGYKIVAGIDNWEDALITFEKNHPGAKTYNVDLVDFDPRQMDSMVGREIDVIVGGPPCQGFSVAGKRKVDDPRNKLYKEFVRVVKYYDPKVFVLENVPNLISMGKGSAKDKIISDFGALGYKVSFKVLLASRFGVPQNRRRVIFVGLKDQHFRFPLESVSEPTTTYEAISDLPEKSLEDGAQYPVAPISTYQKMMRKNSAGVYNHQMVIHKPKTVEIINMVPDGGNYKNLPQELWSTRKVNIAWTRMNSRKPSFTIDTGHNHHFHYKFNRVPTARESARIQSFPDDFIFYGRPISQLKQVGNAVPPLMAEELAKELLKYVKA